MAGSAVAKKTARFGVFDFDLESCELRKSGTRIHLQEQPGRILGVLLENAGSVVTRDALRQAIWPADTFVDFDHGLNTAVRKLRSALDDDAESPKYVETVARQGYRFIQSPEWIVIRDAASPARAPTLSWSARAGIVIVVIGVAAAVGILVRRPGAQPASAAAVATSIDATSASRLVRTIAVLPLVNSDPKTEHVSDGIALHLIDGLSTSSALRVTAPTSSFRYKNTSATATSVGRELAVSVLLTGRLLEKEGQNHIRVEMIDTRDGTQLWSAEYAHPATDVVGLERRVLSDTALRLGITRADRTPQTRSPEAYDLYLRGRFLWNLRYRDNLARAAELLEHAVRIDPNFALAWAALGMAYGTMSGGHYFPGSEAELQRKSGAAIDAALALDPALAEAWTSRAAGKTAYYRDFEGADRDFKRAIELNPSYAQAHSWYSELLVATGRLENARRHADLAQQLDPFSLSANSYACWARFFAREYEEAAEFVRRTRAADQTSKFSNCAPWTRIMMGDYAGAMDEMRVVNPGHADALDAALRERGTDAYWRMRLEQTIQHYPRAVSYAFLGDRDAAFEELNRSFAERESTLILMYVDPRLDPLRSDPRFDALARKIGLPQVRRLATTTP